MKPDWLVPPAAMFEVWSLHLELTCLILAGPNVYWEAGMCRRSASLAVTVQVFPASSRSLLRMWV